MFRVYAVRPTGVSLRGRGQRETIGWSTVRWRAALTLLACAILVASLGHPTAVALKVALLAPELADTPIRPLEWLGPSPRVEEYTFSDATGTVDCDLYLPLTPGTHSGVILLTGVFGTRRDAAMVRFAQGLARSGAVVLVPESSTLRSGDILPDEIDAMVNALAYLRDRPEVDPQRVGLIGFSVGGSLALRTAESDIGQAQVAFVGVSGAYFDARELLQEIATREITESGQRVAWQPHPVATYTLLRQVIGALPDSGDVAILWRVLLDGEPMSDSDGNALSPPGRSVMALAEAPPSAHVTDLIDALPSSSLARLDAISPSTRIDRLRARL